MILFFFTVANLSDSDVAILKLKAPLTFNNHVGPACLPPNQDFYPENVEENVKGIVSGWGLLKDSNFSSLYSYVHMKPLDSMFLYVNEVTLRGQKPPLECC